MFNDDWAKMLNEMLQMRGVKSIKLDEIDQEIERLIMEGKQVSYYSDTVHWNEQWKKVLFLGKMVYW